MDGSEPGEITPAAVLSGAPVDLQGRTVRYDIQCHGEENIELKGCFAEYTVLLNLRHSRETGEATTGEWIGTFYKKVIGGRIHSWDGNRPRIPCKVLT